MSPVIDTRQTIKDESAEIPIYRIGLAEQRIDILRKASQSFDISAAITSDPLGGEIKGHETQQRNKQPGTYHHQ